MKLNVCFEGNKTDYALVCLVITIVKRQYLCHFIGDSGTDDYSLSTVIGDFPQDVENESFQRGFINLSVLLFKKLFKCYRIVNKSHFKGILI